MKLNVEGLIHENSAYSGAVSEDTVSEDIGDPEPPPNLGRTRLLTDYQSIDNRAFDASPCASNHTLATIVSHQNGVVHIQGADAWQSDPLPTAGSSLGFEVVAGTLGMFLVCLGSWLRSFNARPYYSGSAFYRGRKAQSLLERTRLKRTRLKRTWLEEAKLEVESEARFDSRADWLTDLYSRHQMVAIGNRILSDFSVNQPTPSGDDSVEPNLMLLCVNVNRFSSVNAKWGYEAGDELLRRLASRLRLVLRSRPSSVAIARMGSDEFALLLTDASESDIYQVRKGVLKALNGAIEFEGHSIATSCRIGVAQSKASELGCFSELIAQANVAMRECESACKVESVCPQADLPQIDPRTWTQSQLVFLRPHTDDLPRSRFAADQPLEQSIQRAIAQNQLQIHYQPIVDLCSAHGTAPYKDRGTKPEPSATRITRFKTVGFEALIRWQHPELGLLQPAHFLPSAQRLGLAVDIDRWVMETVCRQLCAWRQATPTVNVNLFASHLMQPDLVAYIQQLLKRYPILPYQLNLEVTEGELIEDLNQAADTLHKIRGLGLGISLDDFGSGYSSLSYLDRLPTDVLKIDQSFIQRMSQSNATEQTAMSRSSKVIVEAVLDLAEKLNVRVVAEGIEGVDQLELLKAMHCKYGQGYLFSRPVSARSAEALLSAD